MSRPSYREHDHWRRYQAFFPERLRIEPGREPAESWWPWRGTELHLDRYRPARPRFRAILLHGGGGHGRLLSPLARFLCDEGGEVVAPDLPGYGLSRVPEHLFDYARWIDAASELADAEHAREQLPLLFMGLSLGGMLAFQAASACRAPVRGVIATTLCDPRDPNVRRAFVKGPFTARLGLPLLRVAGRVAPGLRLPIRWFGKMDAIANDPRLAAHVCADPMGGGIHTPMRFLRSLFETRPPLEPEQFRRCPLLLAHPAADRWTPLEVSLPFFGKLACEKRLVLLDGCGHVPIEEPGASQLEAAARAFLEAALADETRFL
jgi:alpha-beta hydrolase superfamily lysophospholipase